MDALFLIILGVFAAVLLALGLIRKQIIFMIFSSVAFIALGVLCVNGILYNSGDTVTNSYICTICNTPSTNVTDCSGTPTPCDDHRSLGLCELYSGCSWNDTTMNCTGEPDDCDLYNADATACEFNGCNVTTTVINGTAGINASVVGSYTLEHNYAVWEDKIGFFRTSTVLGWIFIAFGLFLLFVSGVLIFGGKTSFDFSDDDD